jgi:hypothetical protein
MPIPREHLGPALGSVYDWLDSISSNVSSTVVSGSAVALTTNVTANVTSIVLTPGEWEISGVIGYLPAATTSITVLSGGSSSVSVTDAALGAGFAITQTALVPGAVQQILPIPSSRIKVTASTTFYLVAKSTFTVSTLSAFGVIRALLLTK